MFVGFLCHVPTQLLTSDVLYAVRKSALCGERFCLFLLSVTLYQRCVILNKLIICKFVEYKWFSWKWVQWQSYFRLPKGVKTFIPVISVFIDRFG